MTDVLSIVAGSFGVVMGASPLLQAFRSHRLQSASDVSLAFLAVLILGGSAWLAYGIALSNIAMIIANGVGVASSGTALAVTTWWRLYRSRSATTPTRITESARSPSLRIDEAD
jgi:uncharacterized protein with PQ loop repeat